MRSTSRVILIAVALPLTACILGYVTGVAVQSAPVQWISLGAPPERAVRLLGARQSGFTYSLFVESASGEAYVSSQPRPGAWTTASPQASYHSRACGAVQPPFQIPTPPVDVAACTEFDPGFEATSFEVRRYVLAPDGSVWTWHREQRIISEGAIGAAMGFVAGLLAAIIVVIAYGRAKPPKGAFSSGRTDGVTESRG